MIKVSNVSVWGFEHAVRGMRNPLNSWSKSDSLFDGYNILGEDKVGFGSRLDGIGKTDLSLMQKLYSSGTEHRKFMRQIFVSMDILAPLYWWKEMDQYKVGTTTDSCSTMHKIADKEFEASDFAHEHLFNAEMIKVEELRDIVDSLYFSAVNVSGDLCYYTPEGLLKMTVQVLNRFRDLYLSEKDPELKKKYWWQMIQLLPSSYYQKRTWTGSYENLANILHQRSNHKLDEWRIFCDTIRKECPYLVEIMEK